MNINLEAGLKKLDELDCTYIMKADMRRILLAMQSPCKEECKHEFKWSRGTNDFAEIGCKKCGKWFSDESCFVEKQKSLAEQESHLTLEQRMEEWLNCNHQGHNSTEEWRMALIKKVEGEVEQATERAYQQGMKLSMGEAQRKLIKLAKEEERQRIIQLLTSPLP